MAKARNDAQFAHDVALVNLLANSFSRSPAKVETFKPLKELDHGA